MDSKLFWRNIAGAPAIITDKENVTTGTVIWVQATDGSDSDGYGNNPEAPLASLAYAFSDERPTAGKNDLILLMPGHAESIAAAAGIACDIAGVTVRGLGEGANRPILTFDTDAGADIDIDAANITFENISFRCNIADLAAAIDVNAANFTMRNCSFIGTDAADEAFLIAIITDAAANDMTIENCQFYFLNTVDATAITTTSTECIRLVGADRATIKNCYIEGDFTTSAVNGITTASYGILLLENNITNIATENITGGIDLYTGSTGFMDKNVLYVDDPTSPEDAIDDANLANGVNWVSNAIGDAPIMWGAADALGVEGKLDIVTGFHTVAAKDTTDDAQLRDVIGKKDDTVLTAMEDTKSIAAYVRSLFTETLAYYRSARKTITLDGSSGTGAIGVNTLFTVTGGVEIINVKAVCSTNVAGAGSAEVGIAGATAIFLTQVVDATDIDAGNVWHDATTDAEYELASVYDARGYILGNGQDIILTVAAANLTGGVIGFQVTWIPITSDGMVVAV